MPRFDDDRYYATNDPALALIAKPGALVQWRHYGRGPAYVKLGGRVLYSGADLNATLTHGALSRGLAGIIRTND